MDGDERSHLRTLATIRGTNGLIAVSQARWHHDVELELARRDEPSKRYRRGYAADADRGQRRQASRLRCRSLDHWNIDRPEAIREKNNRLAGFGRHGSGIQTSRPQQASIGMSGGHVGATVEDEQRWRQRS